MGPSGNGLSRTFAVYRPPEKHICCELSKQTPTSSDLRNHLAVLAHPLIATIDRWLQALTDMGLDGIEAHRPALGGTEQLYMEKAAEHFGLFLTGGSDWHGRDKDGPIGTFSVPEEALAGFFAHLRG